MSKFQRTEDFVCHVMGSEGFDEFAVSSVGDGTRQRNISIIESITEIVASV